MRLRAFDVSERTARRGRASALRRFERWQNRWFLIAQCAVTAGLAWLIAHQGLGHPMPFFAPVAAIITLGGTYGQRTRRGIEVAIGVALGVVIGDLWVHFFGTGVWQVMAVCALAMSVATLVGPGQLMLTQAGVQAIIVLSLAGTLGSGVGRWLDALVGCLMALAVATIAPSAPVRRPGRIAAKVLRDMADTLLAAAGALRDRDEARAEAVLDKARASEADLAALNAAAVEGISVVRQSPLYRRQLATITALADLQVPLDHASRNLRVLARRCAVALWRGEDVPLAYLALLSRLADACRVMSVQVGLQRLPEMSRRELIEIGQASAHVKLSDSISAVVILAQLRSMIADLMELTGMDYAEARNLIPEMD
jgi:uncharacterized membrane protein YgaE (UPF0421/DUF939 family)